MRGRTARPAGPLPQRRFWFPATSYYLISAAVAIALFFLVWSLLRDDIEETPWVTAGVAASIVLVGAMVLREIILRQASNQQARLDRQFERQLNDIHARRGDEREIDKLTVEQNALLIREIERKSEAAKVLGRFAAGHREVFEFCEEYLSRNDRELSRIGTGSPRLGPLRKGRDRVTRVHHYHMLQWAEIEARDLMIEARRREGLIERLEQANVAIGVIDRALNYYPTESTLIESRDALNEMITSIRVSQAIEAAEHAVFLGDYKEARSLYRDALFYLGRDNPTSDERDAAAARIIAEVERLTQLESRGG